MVILRFDDAKRPRHNDVVWRHQIIIFIQVVTDAYHWFKSPYRNITVPGRVLKKTHPIFTAEKNVKHEQSTFV